MHDQWVRSWRILTSKKMLSLERKMIFHLRSHEIIFGKAWKNWRNWSFVRHKGYFSLGQRASTTLLSLPFPRSFSSWNMQVFLWNFLKKINTLCKWEYILLLSNGQAIRMNGFSVLTTKATATFERLTLSIEECWIVDLYWFTSMMWFIFQKQI